MEDCEVFVECDCDDCCKPHIGPQGRVGYQGLVEVGVQGNRGYQMDPFVHYGFQGPQGCQGLDVKGQDGFRGPQGLSEQGPQGTIGNQGLLGVGPVGVSGSAGMQGPQGLSIIGVQGDPGVVGIAGAQGSRGAQGNPIDATGPQGPVGAAIIILPFFDRGMQVFSFPTSSALFSSVVLPRTICRVDDSFYHVDVRVYRQRESGGFIRKFSHSDTRRNGHLNDSIYRLFDTFGNNCFMDSDCESTSHSYMDTTHSTIKLLNIKKNVISVKKKIVCHFLCFSKKNDCSVFFLKKKEPDHFKKKKKHVILEQDC